MSRQFLAFLTQLALIVAAVAAVLYILKVDPEVIKLVVAGGVGVLALVALIAALSRLPLRRGEAKKDDGARARRADLRRRARRLRRRIQDAKLGHWLWRRSAAAAPLWLVIGPAGHGRSTLLAAAPGAQERAAKDHEPGQPRFFTTSDAAFIELPESFDADPGYRTLLRALARRWPRQPIAGVLVVARLDALDDDDSRTLLDPAAKLLRRLAADLSVRPPVMLAWTHLDQIPGIAELCHGLSSTDHPLGATLPAYNTPEALLSALEARLHEPRGWIHQRAHALLCRSASASEQANLYGLWQHLDHLLTRAAAAAARLVAQPLVGGELLQLRGLYLLAPLTAPASPRWFESLAQRVGGAYTDEAAPPRPAQLFVQEFFRTELIRDSALAARLRPFLWRRASVHALVAVAAAGLSVYASRAILSAADAERAAMQRTADAARHAPVAPTRQPLPRPDLLQLWRETQRWRAPPDGLADWGLFRGDLLAGPASRLFTRAACNGLIYPLTVESEQILRQLSRRYPTTVPPAPPTNAPSTTTCNSIRSRPTQTAAAPANPPFWVVSSRCAGPTAPSPMTPSTTIPSKASLPCSRAAAQR
jgi:type VI protein secretion system component VasK